MTRYLAIITALALSANVAVAAEDWVGAWAADPAWCADGAGDGVPIRITTDEMQGLGNVCQITNVSPTGVENSWRFDLSCSGEGMPYRTSELIMLTRDGGLARLTEDGILVPMVRCE